MRAIPLTLLCALAGSAAAQTPWELVWSDEFDTLDTEVWQPMIGTGTSYGLPAGWGNEELQYYTGNSQNVYTDGEHLHIVARRNGSSYTSARLRTQGALEVLYGRVEARIDLPKGQGIWPAFWMLPTDSPFGGWAASGEIDVVEAVNQANKVHGTIHFGGGWPQNQSNGGSDDALSDYSTDFHEYAIEWDPLEIRWYVDGRRYHRVRNTQWWSSNADGNAWAPFSSPFHLLLNVAVGGQWPGYPDASTTFPQTMRVDWVKIYQRRAEPFAGEPAPVPGRIQAEAFDLGGGGVGYLDADAGNSGNAFRPGEDVDIESTAGGHNVGWIEPGEWLAYTVDVRRGGAAELRLRVASQATGGRLRVRLDGEDLAGVITVPNTGGWQNWQEITREIDLGAGGERTLRVQAEPSSAGFNLDWLEIESACTADHDGSGVVDVNDLLAFLGAFRTQSPAADADGNGLVNVDDLLSFLGAFRGGCP